MMHILGTRARIPARELLIIGSMSAAACDGRSLSGPFRQSAIGFAVSSGSGLLARATSPTEIDLSWAAASRVTGYQIFRSTTGSGGSYALLASTVSSTYADTGL